MIVLLVEDNFEHLKLTQYVLKQNHLQAEVYVARDGQEAIDFLLRQNSYADVTKSPRPNLVVLDLNIPRVNGREVLGVIKGSPDLNAIPVVVVSSSDREEDIKFAYDNGAATYISKASGFEKYSEALASLHTFASESPSG